MAAPKVAIPVLRQTGKGIKAKKPAIARFIFTGKVENAVPLMHANFKTDNPIIVHLDCDLYSSALYCLTKLDTALPPGTILIFDEFGDVQHEFRAVHDYLSSYRREVSVLCSHDDFFAIAVELQ